MTSNAQVTNPSSAIESARALMASKDKIQDELDAQLSILTSQSCTMNTPLVDEQGFPRADIDVYAVRQARVRIIELRNDLQDVTDKIKLALEVLHSEPREPAPEPVPSNPSRTTVLTNGIEEDVAQLRPFARVDGVMPGSPSADAGLRREDLLLKFGHLNASSFSGTSLQPLAELVSRHENASLHQYLALGLSNEITAFQQSLTVKIRRGTENITISFTPRSGWGGRGLLGCHIVPYTT